MLVKNTETGQEKNSVDPYFSPMLLYLPNLVQSTVCSKIMELLGQNDLDHRKRQVAILSQDSFYQVLTPEQKAKAIRGQFNFDHPGRQQWFPKCDRGADPEVDGWSVSVTHKMDLNSTNMYLFVKHRNIMPLSIKLYFEITCKTLKRSVFFFFLPLHSSLLISVRQLQPSVFCFVLCPRTQMRSTMISWLLHCGTSRQGRRFTFPSMTLSLIHGDSSSSQST